VSVGGLTEALGSLSVARPPPAPAAAPPPPPVAAGAGAAAMATAAAAAASATAAASSPAGVSVDDAGGSEPELDARSPVFRRPTSPHVGRRQFPPDSADVATDDEEADSDLDDAKPSHATPAVAVSGRRASAASTVSDWGDVVDGVAIEDTSVTSTTPRLSTVPLSDTAASGATPPTRHVVRQPPPPSRPRLMRVASDGPGGADLGDGAASAATPVARAGAATPVGGSAPRMMPSASFTAGSVTHRSPPGSGTAHGADEMCTQCSGLERRIAELVMALKTAPSAAGDGGDGSAAGSSSGALGKTGSGWGLKSMSSLVSKSSKSTGERARLRQEVDVLRATVSFLHQRLQDAEEGAGVGGARLP